MGGYSRCPQALRGLLFLQREILSIGVDFGGVFISEHLTKEWSQDKWFRVWGIGSISQRGAAVGVSRRGADAGL